MSKKTLCNWDKKTIEKNIEKLVMVVSSPKYVCTKCARAARKETYLCKPQKLKPSAKKSE